MIFFIGSFFVVLLVIPFSLGMLELYQKNDDKALFINGQYCKDPRYFANSFKNIFDKAIEKPELSDHQNKIYLSKEEMFINLDKEKLTYGADIDKIIYAENNGLNTENNAVFLKEVYIHKDITFGKKNLVRAVKGNQTITLNSGCRIIRWCDAEQDLIVGHGCNLGISASSNNQIILTEKCLFKRLYAPLIMIKEIDEQFKKENYQNDLVNKLSFYGFTLFTERDLAYVEQGIIKNCNIITKKSLTLAEEVVIGGSIKTYGGLVIGKNSIVKGNVFAESDVILLEDARILGTVFTQSNVILYAGATVGEPGKIKSIIAKKDIRLMVDVKVYGYVAAEGQGYVI